MKFNFDRKQEESLSENQKKFEIAKREVGHIVDKLGLGIDEQIKDTVAIFRAMDFPTSSSCAGHTEEDSFGPPYLEVYSKAPEGWKEDKEKQELWRQKNLKQRAKLEPLLAQFYKNRKVLADIQLHLSNMGMFGAFRLQSAGVGMKSDELGIKTKEEALDKIKLYQKEMAEFTKFVMSIFLGQKL